MPCWRCGAREVDPVRGPSPWKRAVRAGAHVLVCPDCQLQPEWTAQLDHCLNCGSWRLVRQLGAVSCRSCGTMADAAGRADLETSAAPPSDGPPSDRPALAADVRAALERMWGRAGQREDR